MWKQLANERGEVNSAYGKLIFADENEHGFSQYQWVIESLIKDKDSRQAFMHFNKPEHQYNGNKDQVCTLTALFHIRNNKLNMTLNMRSNDVIFGFMTDFTFFNILHQHVYLHLKETYPEIEMGSYTHTSHSMHLYERHYDLVRRMIEEEFILHGTPELNSPILTKTGMINDIYSKLFSEIVQNKPITTEYTDNNLLNWSLEQLKNIKA
jgi:thymidylate synthase